jgi:hypothetical protein
VETLHDTADSVDEESSDSAGDDDYQDVGPTRSDLQDEKDLVISAKDMEEAKAEILEGIDLKEKEHDEE